MQNQSYKLHSPLKLTGFLKKFSSIEKTLLFEIDEDRVIAKTHTPDKSVVKIGSVLLSDIMDPLGSYENVKIGLFAVDNFISAFKHFAEIETKLEVSAEKLNDVKHLVSSEIKLTSRSLKVSFPCATMSMFRYIDSDLAKKISDTSSNKFSFRIDKETLAKISALCALDSDNETITIVSKSGEVFFKGKNFELNLSGTTTEEDGEISFYKAHFAFIDREDSEIFVTDSKIICNSLEADMATIIGRVE